MIELTNVGKRFGAHDGALALRDVDLTIHDGEFICIVGPSGCGKTTLLNLLAGFETPSTGTITLDGRPVVRPDRDRVVVFQDPTAALMPWLDVEQNVAFGLRLQKGLSRQERQRIVRRSLELVGMAEHGGKFIDELSGGMRQRVQIARGLALEPPILLMDEPFGALDGLTRRRMQRELEAVWLKQRSTVVFVTHDIDEAVVLADRVVVMGTPSEPAIRRVVDVDVPRPRHAHASALADVVSEIERHIGGAE